MKAGTRTKPYVPRDKRKPKVTDEEIANRVLSKLCEEHPAEMGAILGSLAGMEYANRKNKR